MKTPQIFICGGGTGGHFFSGVALAEAFLKKFPQYTVTFIGTKNGIEGRTQLEDPRMRIHFIRAKGLKGKSFLSKFSGIFYLAFGFFESCGLLLLERPQIVVGVGGYASAPTVMAALLTKWLGGWKIAVLEQNSTPGLVNRLFSFFPLLAMSAFPRKRFRVIDLPLRQSTIEKAGEARSPVWPPKNIFILGGSQGARSLNNLWKALVPKVLEAFPHLQIVHQTGVSQEEEFKNFYRTLNVNAEVFAFSNEMVKFYGKADLLLCRSGAMTVFEIIAFKRPCIFVPFPAATDDHQWTNAISVQNAEWVIREHLLTAEKIISLIRSPQGSVPKRIAESENWDALFSKLL